MFNKLFALSAVALMLGACEIRPPLAEGPVGPPPGAKAFTVFFETGSSTLNTQAMSTLDKAASSFKGGGVAKVTATGHADTVGSLKSNMTLSLNRADAVKGALVTRGVPADSIIVVGRGEDNLVVKTADDVAEPKNRVVEITLK